MARIDYEERFIKIFSKIKHKDFQEQMIKAIEKIKQNPETGKPMRFNRKGTREIYISHYRLSYLYLKDEDKIVILDLYHKDEQ